MRNAHSMITSDRTLEIFLGLTGTAGTKDRNHVVDETLRATCQLVEAAAASFVWIDGRRASRTTLLESGAQVVDEHPNPHDGLTRQVMVEGRGAILKDVEGREYIDGLSCLWNVNAGHGRAELAQAGGKNPEGLASALGKVFELVEKGLQR